MLSAKKRNVGSAVTANSQLREKDDGIGVPSFTRGPALTLLRRPALSTQPIAFEVKDDGR